RGFRQEAEGRAGQGQGRKLIFSPERISTRMQNGPSRGRFFVLPPPPRQAKRKRAAPSPAHPFANHPARCRGRKNQRFENWKLRRAFALPYFLRSTTRLSRVRKPPFLSTARRPGS